MGCRSIKEYEKPLILFAITGLLTGLSIHFFASRFGLDPHHDFFGLAPGLLMEQGLKPHGDFYTHYGPIDGAIKSIIWAVSDNNFLAARRILVILQFVGVASCYLCIRWTTRCDSAPYLLMAGTIFLWSPQSSHDWDMLFWSSDIAAFLINILIVCKGFSTLIEHKLENRTISKKRLLLKDCLNFASGFIVASIFFCKITIGTAMLVATPICRILPALIAEKDGKGIKKRSVFMNLTNYQEAAGILLGVLFSIHISGGIGKARNMLNDLILGDHITSSSGGITISELIELGKNVLLSNEFLWIYGLTTTAIFSFKFMGKRWYTGPIVYLGSSAIIFALAVKNNDQMMQITGYMHHLIMVVYLCAWAAAGCRILKSKQIDAKVTAWYCVTVPLGIASLTQFYPLNDPHHTWWSLINGLPAFGISTFTIKESTFKKLILSGIAILTATGALWSSLNMHKKNEIYVHKVTDTRGNDSGIFTGLSTRQEMVVSTKYITFGCDDKTNTTLETTVLNGSYGHDVAILASDKSTLKELVECTRGRNTEGKVMRYEHKSESENSSD